jgi:outer membrane beta-barrel protein
MKTRKKIKKWIPLAALGWSVGLSAAANAAEKNQPAQTGAEEVKVEQIKQKYWAGGEEAAVGVVQNRAYSKTRKFSLGVDTGIAFSDPFLSNKIVGGHFGYNFSEYYAVEFLYWRILSSGSSAYDALRAQGKDANVNPQRGYMGADFLASLMYGKLSFVGHKIIYYDFHLSGGGGMIDTESGRYAAGTVGLGQRFYISTVTSLRLDYRMMGYKERIIEKVITPKYGQVAGERWNWGHTIVLGLDFLIGGGGGKDTK